MALDTKLQIALDATFRKTAVLGSIPNDPLSIIKTITFGNGTGAGNADKLYYAERLIAAGGASETLDINGGLTDNLGQPFNPVRIKGLWVINAPNDPTVTQNTNDLVIGAAAANQFSAILGTTGTETLKPGAHSLHWAGAADATAWASAAGTNDQLKIANSAGAGGANLTYQIIIVGVSV